VTAPLPPRIVLYDGVCGLCSASVKFLIRRDHARMLHFAPLQGDTAAALRAQYPQIPDQLSTVVLIDDGRVFLRSKAFLYVSKYLTRPWRWGYWFRWLPGPLLNIGYRIIAAMRYRIWGKKDTCEIPMPEERARFLA
jgi:predicted DCC family thiol-disulfide oxidoreductase YuxK